MLSERTVLGQFLVVRNLSISDLLVFHQCEPQPVFLFIERLGFGLDGRLCRIRILLDVFHFQIQLIDLRSDFSDEYIHLIDGMVLIWVDRFTRIT